MDRYIEDTPMPEEYKNAKMTIICNECQAESCIPFHVSGGKCQKCFSYNTSKTKDTELVEIEKAFDRQK